jgi:signal peptidase II
MPWTRKARLFWPLAVTVLLADCASKRIAETALTPAHVPHRLFGEVVRLTLAYNPGAAMSLSLGPYSRLGFSLLAVAALVVLAGLYRRLPRGAELAAAGLALVAGGALGNALDRLRSARGVVDFMDVGVGAARFWTFNVADMAITVGAIFLAIALSRPTREKKEAGPPDRAV